MPALFGYLVAVSILLGGAYAGLQWLAAPQGGSAEKTSVHTRNAPDKSAATRMGGVAAPNAADHQANAETPGKNAAVERSEEIDREAKHVGVNAVGQSPKVEKGGSAPAGGCGPIGLTANGDLVFSLQCQEMIERHRRELASSEAAASAPAPAVDQALPSTKPNNGNEDGVRDRARDVAVQPSDDGADKPRNDAVARDENNRANPDAEHQVAPPEPTAARGSVTTGENRSRGAKPNLEPAPAKNAKQKRIPQTKPEAISRTAESHDAGEQRSPPVSRSRRVAARGDSELWYNVLGLR
jgi:hypothetical protein